MHKKYLSEAFNPLLKHINNTPNKIAFTYLNYRSGIAENITYYELDKAARKIAVALSKEQIDNKPVMILMDNPVHFAAGFFGCIYAGKIVVPAPVPIKGKSWARMKSIADDAGIELVLSDQQTINHLKDSTTSNQAFFSDYRWISLEETEVQNEFQWREPILSDDKPVFLQYTSGSTGSPKGVMVTQNNIASNVRDISSYFLTTSESRMVSWLPLFHDMGLVGHLIHPAIIGCQSILIKPLDFIKRPARWLKAISDYQACLSGAPNFAYELCLTRISNKASEELDLSSWQSAYIGAEPVRSNTLERFFNRFKENGLQRSSLLPVYGLSEGTLLVAGVERGAEIPIKKPAQENESDQLLFRIQKEVVGCGKPIRNQKILIIDPTSGELLKEGEVGEVWLRGDNIASGYWQKSEATSKIFRATLISKENEAYLRTGDLGFLHKQALFLTGRLKEILIVKGENFSATDLESSAEVSHPDLPPGCCAAFSIMLESREEAVLAIEINPKATEAKRLEIVSSICKTFSFEYGFQPFDIVFLPHRSLPRTTSGKIIRQQCKKQYLNKSWKKQPQEISHPALGKQRLTNKTEIAYE